MLRVGAGLLLALAVPGCIASSESSLSERDVATPLTTTQVKTYKPYSYFAAAAFCGPILTQAWTCGINCLANPSFVPTSTGGDGTLTQYWYTGYDPILQSVIVGHQGDHANEILPVLESGNLIQVPLDPSLFPGISPSVLVHSGFAASQSASAKDVLAGVQYAMATYNTQSVTIVGHGQGGAIALLSAVYLSIHLPAIAKIRTVTYGMPRVGNQDFVNYVDSHNLGLSHINNRKDPVPILPAKFAGFHHPSGEIHIRTNGVWSSCPGQDTTAATCTIADVPTILDGVPADHEGLYDGVAMLC